MLGAIEPQTRRPGTRTIRSVLVLEPANSRLPVEPVLLTPGDHTLGSGDSCSVSLPFQGVQPRHCEITVRERTVTVRALDRRTWLNNGPLTEARLHKGDRLVLGPVEFRVGEMTTQEEPPAPPHAEIPAPVRGVQSPRIDRPRVVEQSRRELAAETSASAEARIDEAAALIERLMNEEGVSVESEEPAPSSDARGLERRRALLEDLLTSVQDQADDVRQRGERISAKERSITERERRIGQVETEILERMRHCDVWESQLQTRSNELRTTQNDSDSSRRLLEERWSELELQKRALDAESIEVDKIRNATSSAEQQLRHLEDQLVAREEQIYQTAERLSDAEQELEARRAEADVFEAECIARSQELTAMSKDLASRSSELEKRSAALDELTRTCAAQQAEFDARRAALDADRQQIDERLASQSRRSDAVAAAQQDLDVSRTVLEEAWAKLDADRKSLDEHSRVLEAREREATCAEGRLRLEREWIAQERSKLESLRLEPSTTPDTDRFAADEARVEEELRRLENDRSALDAARAEIERARASQQSARAELTERENRFREEQKAIESARIDLQKKSEAFEADQAAFRTTREELAAERARLAEERHSFEHEKTALHASMQNLSHSHLENAAWFEQHTAELAELERRRQELSEREAALAGQEAELDQGASALAENEQELSQRALELEAENAQLASARQSLARREVESLGEIAAQKSTVEALRQQLAEREAALAAERSEIESTRQSLEQTRSEIHSAETELRSARSELESGRTELQAARQKLDDEAEWLRQDQKHIETVHDEIATNRRTLLKEREELEALRARLEGIAAAPVVAPAPLATEDTSAAFVAPSVAASEWPETGHATTHHTGITRDSLTSHDSAKVSSEAQRFDEVPVDESAVSSSPDVEPGRSLFAGFEPVTSQPAESASTPFAVPAFDVPDFAATARSAFEPTFPSPFGAPVPVDSPFRAPTTLPDESTASSDAEWLEATPESSSPFSMAGAFAPPAASAFPSHDMDSPFRSHPTPQSDQIEEGFAQAAFDFRPETAAASTEDAEDLPRMPRVVSDESSAFRMPRGLEEDAGFRRPSLVNRGWGEADSSRLFGRRSAEDVPADEALETRGHGDLDVGARSESSPDDRGERLDAPGESSKGGDDHRVQELRSQLAALFDLKKDAGTGSSHHEEEPAATEDEPEVDDRGIDIQGLLGSLRGRPEEEPEPEPVVVERIPEPEPPKPPKRSVVVNDIDDSASVAAYMEQLFARNRRAGADGIPEPTLTPKSRVPAPEPERPKPVESFVVEAPSAEALETAKAGLSEPAAPAAVPEPLHKPNRDAIRASIHSLRQVANLNARTALAKHSGQQARSTLQLKATLVLVAVGLAAILLVPGLLGSMGLRAYGWALVGVGLVATAEVLMTMRRVRGAGTSKGAESAPAEPAPSPSEATPAATDQPTP